MTMTAAQAQPTFSDVNHTGFNSFSPSSEAAVNALYSEAAELIQPPQLRNASSQQLPHQHLEASGGDTPEPPIMREIAAQEAAAEQLFESCKEGKDKIVAALLKEGRVDLNSLDAEGKTPLMFAVLGGHKKCVQHLIHYGALLEIVDHAGGTAVHWASHYGQTETLKLLIKKGARVEMEDYRGKTPLHWAMDPESSDVLSTLLKSIKDVNCSDDENMTPLMWAMYRGHDVQASMLLKRGASLDMCDIEGKTAMHWCTSNKHNRCAQVLIEAFEVHGNVKEILNRADKSGRTPLHLAVAEGSVTVVDYLIKSGADMGARDNSKRTPVHWAAVSGKAICLKILADNGASLSSKDEHGATAAHYSVQLNHHDCLSILIRRKVHLSDVDIAGRQPLIWGASEGRTLTCKLLLEAGVNVDSTEKKGLTALHCAAYAGHIKLIDLLLRFGANVNARDSKHHTPLFRCAIAANLEAIERLLSTGKTSVCVYDHDGRSPLHWSCGAGNLKVVSFLIKKGSDIDHIDQNGTRALHEAAFHGHYEIVDALLKASSSPDRPDHKGITPLHWAAKNGHLKCALRFLNTSAAVSPMDSSKGRLTPLDFAYNAENLEVAGLLLDYGACTRQGLCIRAALRIQRVWRAYYSRKTLHVRERLSAIRIQSIWRGYDSRKTVERIRFRQSRCSFMRIFFAARAIQRAWRSYRDAILAILNAKREAEENRRREIERKEVAEAERRLAQLQEIRKREIEEKEKKLKFMKERLQVGPSSRTEPSKGAHSKSGKGGRRSKKKKKKNGDNHEMFSPPNPYAQVLPPPPPPPLSESMSRTTTRSRSQIYIEDMPPSEIQEHLQRKEIVNYNKDLGKTVGGKESKWRPATRKRVLGKNGAGKLKKNPSPDQLPDWNSAHSLKSRSRLDSTNSSLIDPPPSPKQSISVRSHSRDDSSSLSQTGRTIKTGSPRNRGNVRYESPKSKRHQLPPPDPLVEATKAHAVALENELVFRDAKIRQLREENRLLLSLSKRALHGQRMSAKHPLRLPLHRAQTLNYSEDAKFERELINHTVDKVKEATIKTQEHVLLSQQAKLATFKIKAEMLRKALLERRITEAKGLRRSRNSDSDDSDDDPDNDNPNRIDLATHPLMPLSCRGKKLKGKELKKAIREALDEVLKLREDTTTLQEGLRKVREAAAEREAEEEKKALRGGGPMTIQEKLELFFDDGGVTYQAPLPPGMPEKNDDEPHYLELRPPLPPVSPISDSDEELNKWAQEVLTFMQ